LDPNTTDYLSWREIDGEKADFVKCGVFASTRRDIRIKSNKCGMSGFFGSKGNFCKRKRMVWG
jgi:hypothetical protein